jgi:hypothetical protein
MEKKWYSSTINKVDVNIRCNRSQTFLLNTTIMTDIKGFENFRRTLRMTCRLGSRSFVAHIVVVVSSGCQIMMANLIEGGNMLFGY